LYGHEESGGYPMKKKNIAIAIIIAGVIVLTSVVLYEKANEPPPWEKYSRYEYYIDYGSHVTEILKNGWVSDLAERGKSQLQVLQGLADVVTD